MTNLDDLVLDHAARRTHRHHITLFLGDQGASDGRADGDLAELDVSLVLTNDLIGHAFVSLNVSDLYRGAENHFAGRGNGRDIDDLRVLHAPFDITDTRLNHTLLLASSVVFGVFFKVTQLAGRADVLAELRTHDLGQVGVFFFQGACALDGHWVLDHAFNPACRSCKRRTVF